MLRAYKVFLATGYPQRELVGTMKRLLACLALCASLFASAQDDNCTVLGVQELSIAYMQLGSSMDSAVYRILSKDFSEMDFENFEFRFPEAGYSSFQNANLNGADLNEAFLQHADFSGASCIEADFSNCNSVGANFSNANLTNANFYGARLTGVHFDGAILTGATMTCLETHFGNGCPSILPAGYVCEPDPNCNNRYRIVPE